MATTTASGDAPSVVIVGAGLSGCLSAVLLAQRGCKVDVYDYRHDPETSNGERNATLRSINLAMSTRGLTALSKANLGEEVARLGVPMHGRCVHQLSGEIELQRYGHKGQHLLSISRSELNAVLLRACKATKAVDIHFGMKCVSVDLQAASATFVNSAEENDANAHTRVSADLVIGADGTFSRVRASMMREDMFDYSQTYISAAYKELRLVPHATANMQTEWLHIWPRHRFMLIALPNITGSFTCTLFLDRAEFDLLKEKQSIETFFRRNFPDALEMMPSLVEDFISNPTPSLLTVRCAPYHYRDKALLIGDAAHAMVPFYGQGCNAAFEDCRILAELIDEHGWRDRALLLREFTRLRKQNVDTMADLALDNYTDMASRTARPSAVLRRRLGLLLNRLLPRQWIPLYTMISFSNIPYAEAVERAKAQDEKLHKAITFVKRTAAAVVVARVAGCIWREAQRRSQNGTALYSV